MNFATKLIDKKEVAKDTMSFYFEKPTDFIYKAGQYIQITLINPPETDDEGDKRLFSLSSAPHEKYIMITTRIRDTAFKRVLKKQSLGYEVDIRGPMGLFTLHEDPKMPAVFLVGGIGITPFRSIILDATEKKLPQSMTLFYSNHNKQEAAFFDELTEASQLNSCFTFVPIMTRDETWSGEKNRINMQIIQEKVPDFKNVMFYTAGPRAMVDAMRNLLKQAGIDDDHIKFEDFTGY